MECGWIKYFFLLAFLRSASGENLRILETVDNQNKIIASYVGELVKDLNLRNVKNEVTDVVLLRFEKKSNDALTCNLMMKIPKENAILNPSINQRTTSQRLRVAKVVILISDVFKNVRKQSLLAFKRAVRLTNIFADSVEKFCFLKT